MNILVTGANGQLGNEMRIISKETSYNFLFTDVVEAEGVETTLLDITDAEAVEKMVQEQHINCIVNCAAYTNVDKAESDAALCRKLNAAAPKILSEAMKKAGGLLVQISTDYVLEVIRIIHLAVKTKRVRLRECMAKQSWKENGTLRIRDATT